MNEFIELRSIITAIARRWWIFLLLALAFGAVGYFVSSNQTPIYQATTSLFVGNSIQSAEVDRNDLQASQLLASTYTDLARRQLVLQRAIDELGLDISWGQLRSQVRTEVPGNNPQLLEVQVEADSPQEAVAIADEIARQLILLSPSGGVNTTAQAEDEDYVQQRMSELQLKIESGQERLEELEIQFLLTSNSNEKAIQLGTQIDALQGMINRWENSYIQFRGSLKSVDATNNLAILEPAQVNPKPVRPSVKLSTMIAAIIGVFLGLGLIFMIELFDNTLKTPSDLKRVLGLSTLGAINQTKSKNPRDALVVNHDSFSPTYEDYRLLRTKIQFMSIDHPGRAVMITSPGRSEGKSLTVANLGIVMAQAGLKTIIIDANLRQPIMHELFQLPNQEGLTHLLRGQDQNIDRYLQQTLSPNLRVLPSGTVPSNPSELLGSKRMSNLLEGLGSVADIIICDSPEAVTVADASVLSNKMDGVLLVIDTGHTDRNVALQAVANLRDANANLIGGILNRVSLKGRDRAFSQANTTTTIAQSQPQEPLTFIESPGG